VVDHYSPSRYKKREQIKGGNKMFVDLLKGADGIEPQGVCLVLGLNPTSGSCEEGECPIGGMCSFGTIPRGFLCLLGSPPIP